MLEPPPHLCERTGISRDYMSEYAEKSLTYSMMGEEAFFRILRERPIRRYEERFDPEVYAIDSENLRIQSLNQIANGVNSMVKEKRLDLETFLRIENEVYELVFGRPRSEGTKILLR